MIFVYIVVTLKEVLGYILAACGHCISSDKAQY